LNDSHDTSIGQWLFRLFAWDGLLPPAIWLLPLLLRNLMPKNDVAIAFVIVLVPIAALFVRYSVGMKHIRENHCGPIIRGFQTRVFWIAILMMVLVDVLAIAMQDIVPFEDQMVFALIAYVIYLPLMAFALYPGFSKQFDTGNEYGMRQTTRLNEFGGEEYV
jgi:hypothetical protein